MDFKRGQELLCQLPHRSLAFIDIHRYFGLLRRYLDDQFVVCFPFCLEQAWSIFIRIHLQRTNPKLELYYIRLFHDDIMIEYGAGGMDDDPGTDAVGALYTEVSHKSAGLIYEFTSRDAFPLSMEIKQIVNRS